MTKTVIVCDRCGSKINECECYGHATVRTHSTDKTVMFDLCCNCKRALWLWLYGRDDVIIAGNDPEVMKKVEARIDELTIKD